jgi:hypothetical protein
MDDNANENERETALRAKADELNLDFDDALAFAEAFSSGGAAVGLVAFRKFDPDDDDDYDDDDYDDDDWQPESVDEALDMMPMSVENDELKDYIREELARKDAEIARLRTEIQRLQGAKHAAILQRMFELKTHPPSIFGRTPAAEIKRYE